MTDRTLTTWEQAIMDTVQTAALIGMGVDVPYDTIPAELMGLFEDVIEDVRDSIRTYGGGERCHTSHREPTATRLGIGSSTPSAKTDR